MNQISSDVIHGSMYMMLSDGTPVTVAELGNRSIGTKHQIKADLVDVREVEVRIGMFSDSYSATAMFIRNIRTLYRTSCKKIYFKPGCAFDLHEQFVFRSFDKNMEPGAVDCAPCLKKFVRVKTPSYNYHITPGPVLLSPAPTEARPEFAFLPFYIE